MPKLKILLSAFVWIMSACNVWGQLYDAYWPLGYTLGYPTENPYNGNSDMIFTEDTFSLQYVHKNISFDRTNASISDSAGNVLLYTNGLKIFGANHQPIIGGDSINANGFMESWLAAMPNSYVRWGYPARQGAMFLPADEETGVYFLFYFQIDPELTYHNIYFSITALLYSKIKYNPAIDQFEVVLKDQVLVADTLLTDNGITATRHGNGRDWWLVFSDQFNETYYKVLLDVENETFEVTTQENDDEEIHYFGVGSSKFSPDGSMYAKNYSVTLEDGHFIVVTDFDRCTGELTNFRWHIEMDTAWSQSCEFSPNGRFLYVTAHHYLYQIDLHAPTLTEGFMVLDTADFSPVVIDDEVSLPWGTSMFMIQRAPNNKLYISSNSGVNTLHVIHNPDELGKAANVQQRGVVLPRINGFSVPNFPNYRLGPLEGSPCDTLGLVNTVPEPLPFPEVLEVYPNPATDMATVAIPSPGSLSVYDLQGRLLYQSKAVHPGNYTLATGSFPAGVYIVLLQSEAGELYRTRLGILR